MLQNQKLYVLIDAGYDLAYQAVQAGHALAQQWGKLLHINSPK